MRLPRAPVLGSVEERPHLVEQRQPLGVGQVGDPAQRGEERHELLPVDRLRVRQPRLLELVEGRRRQRMAPLARRIVGRVQVQRVDPDLLATGPAFGQEPLHSRDRRLRRPGRQVPHHDERTPRRQDAGDLGKRALVVEPVERLGGEDGVHRPILERNVFAAAGERLCSGTGCREQAPHRIGRLDGDHPLEHRDEQTRELAGARAQFEHRRLRRQARDPDDLRRPARTTALVVLRPAVGAAGGHAPAGRHPYEAGADWDRSCATSQM